jgi:uncharacterized HAD superfamily protein
MTRVIAVDLDGVLCQETPGYDDIAIYHKKPIKRNIDRINGLFSRAMFIIVFTCRKEDARISTEAWLKRHGVHYHVLVMEKVYFDVYIDEKRKFQAIEDM